MGSKKNNKKKKVQQEEVGVVASNTHASREEVVTSPLEVGNVLVQEVTADNATSALEATSIPQVESIGEEVTSSASIQQNYVPPVTASGLIDETNTTTLEAEASTPPVVCPSQDEVVVTDVTTPSVAAAAPPPILKKKSVVVKSPQTMSQDQREPGARECDSDFFGKTLETKIWEDDELSEEADEEFSEWFFRCLWEMIKIALPVTFSVSLTNAAFVFTIYFAAHTLEKIEFAGLAMGLSFSNITAQSLGAGLSCALDTLCSQEHGRDPSSKRIGLYLQRAFLGTLCLFTPLTVLYCFSEPVLASLIQPEIAHYAAYWLKFSAVVSLPTVLTTCLQKYVQCHGDSVIVLYSSILGTVTVPFFLTHLAHYGLNGFLLALCLNRTLILLILIIFSARKPELQATWPGVSALPRAARWRAMRRYFIVGLPSMAAFCADLWGFEAMAVMAGRLGATEVAVWMIVINIQGLCWGPCVGICSAAAVRVGNALGAGKPKEAQRMLKGAIVLSIIIGTICGGITIFGGSTIVHLLQRDPEVIERAKQVLQYNGAALFLDIQFYVLQGIYRGCGKQSLAAKLVAFGHWCIGIPLSAILALQYGVGVRGILIGFITGMVVVIPIFVHHLFFKFDWPEMAKVISTGPTILGTMSKVVGGDEESAATTSAPHEMAPLVGIIKNSSSSRSTILNMTSAPGGPLNNTHCTSNNVNGEAMSNYGGTSQREDQLDGSDNSSSRHHHHHHRRLDSDNNIMVMISPSLGPASGETIHGSTAGGTITGGSASTLLQSMLDEEARSPTSRTLGDDGNFPTVG